MLNCCHSFHCDIKWFIKKCLYHWSWLQSFYIFIGLCVRWFILIQLYLRTYQLPSSICEGRCGLWGIWMVLQYNIRFFNLKFKNFSVIIEHNREWWRWRRKQRQRAWGEWNMNFITIRNICIHISLTHNNIQHSI